MTSTFSITSAFLLSGSLLLAGCASTGQSQSSSTPSSQTKQSYKFPKEIYEGYWAMPAAIEGESVVVNFREGASNNYRFKCNANGNFQQISVEKNKLEPSATGMVLRLDNEPLMSELRLVRLAPKQVLILNQNFLVPELKQAMPDGLEMAYIYTPTLKPLCP